MLDFRNFIENYTSLPSDYWAIIESKLSKASFKENEIILREGQICQHLYFLKSGLLRYYVFNDGSEVTKFFTDAPYLFTSQISFAKRVPSKEHIQALEPSEVLVINHKEAFALLRLASWSNFVRALIQEVQFFTEQILVEMQTVKAEDRYAMLLRDNPGLLNRIPLKYIASYLGIQPQSLSRIRKDLINKK